MQKHFDGLGRIHIAKELRQKLGFSEKTPLKISADTRSGRIIIEKQMQDCIVCGKAEDLIKMKEGVFCCKSCMMNIVEKISSPSEIEGLDYNGKATHKGWLFSNPAATV